LALMELNASRTAARTDAQGEPILRLEQNRGLWDQLQIRRGMLALARVRELGGAGGRAAGGHRRLSRPGAHSERN
jgi:predicted RNA polymerase sigma factor